MSEIADRFEEALDKFREGRYFEAHEGFEYLWHGAEGADRDLYQGWVLAAAALFHRDRGNARGAASCLARAEEHWRRVPTPGPGADLPRVLQAIRGVLGREWAPPDLSGPRRRGRGEAEEEL